MRNIRRILLADIAKSKRMQKAVAFAICLKKITNDSSVIRSYTPNKVHKLTGMHPNTVKKYLGVLMEMELAEIKGGDLYIKSLRSSSNHRNLDISQFTFDKTKNIYHQIRSLLFLIIQSHKDYIKSLLRLRHDPDRRVDFKKVRRVCKKCCKNPNAEYQERGLSYSSIAKKIGVCARTAFKVVGYALKRKWCRKQNNCIRVMMKGVCYREVEGFTFTTLNWGYVVRANSYSLSKNWSRSLNCDPISDFLSPNYLKKLGGE